MLTHFTPQLQAYLMLCAVAIFAAAVYFTRATYRRGVAAFAAALVFTVFNILWDIAAYHAHWWWYPSLNRSFGPLSIYLAQNLVWGGAWGLLGWRIQRRFGLLGLILFIFFLSSVGNIRDFTIASATKLIMFGSGYVPRLADLVCWATLLAIAQITIRLIAGPSERDSLSARVARPQSKN